ncbi:MAG: hypothetical protein EOP49_48540 [Sphingobacteriales bacterium]|nr:MAG: hypothetical protein EOP49_48540 [Sphingobacteriales bacterium]
MNPHKCQAPVMTGNNQVRVKVPVNLVGRADPLHNRQANAPERCRSNPPVLLSPARLINRIEDKGIIIDTLFHRFDE